MQRHDDIDTYLEPRGAVNGNTGDTVDGDDDVHDVGHTVVEDRSPYGGAQLRSSDNGDADNTGHVGEDRQSGITTGHVTDRSR